MLSGLISAIVPTFNRADFLVEAVDALIAQTRSLHQIVIWDDGSTDHTRSVMSKYKSFGDTEILCMSAENAGKSKALNQAIAHTTGDYIWICDDDDIAFPDAAAELGHVLDNSLAGVVAARHERFQIDPISKRKDKFDSGYWPDLTHGSIFRHLLEDIFFFQPATLVRRTAYDKVGPFREDLSRSIDYEMFVRLAARFPVELIDRVVFAQRKHDGARGPVKDRHQASQSEAVWKANDQEIFSHFRSTLPLSLYEALFDGTDPRLVRRAALLQRGCVYARRSDWVSAIGDFTTAIDSYPDAPLSETEHAIAVRALAGKHGSSAAFHAPILQKLLALRLNNAAGHSLCRALARGAVWRARQALTSGQISEFAKVAAFISKAGFPTNAPRDPEVPRLWERTVLPPEAYAW